MLFRSYLTNTPRILLLLTTSTATAMIQTTFTSCMGYCNKFLTSLPTITSMGHAPQSRLARPQARPQAHQSSSHSNLQLMAWPTWQPWVSSFSLPGTWSPGQSPGVCGSCGFFRTMNRVASAPFVLCLHPQPRTFHFKLIQTGCLKWMCRFGRRNLQSL